MRIVLLSLCILFGFSSCSLVDNSSPVIITSIHEELVMDLWNPLNSESKFAIHLSTIETECPSSEIRTTMVQPGNDIVINILGLVQEADCAGDYKILSKAIPANVSIGTYDVIVKLSESIVNHGTLEYNGTSYKLEMLTADGLKVGNNELYRIPDGVVWGTLLSDTNSSQVNSEWIDRLDLLGEDADLATGYYGHFSVLDADVQVPVTTGHLYRYPFIYRLEGSVTDLEAAVSEFRSTFGSQISELRCFTWDGREF